MNLEYIHNRIIYSQKSLFKINHTFEFVLRNLKTHQMRFLYTSSGNTRVLPESALISDNANLHCFSEGDLEKNPTATVTRLKRNSHNICKSKSSLGSMITIQLSS